MVKKEKKSEIKVGDLVRLKDDDSVSVGVGLVLEKREDCSEIVDLLDDLRADAEEIILEEIPEFLLFKPIYLVLWQGENISPTDKPVWMFNTELDVVDK
tara:strand:- start:167 stop:463 length:297 start_codon:yes stop_codon:yes gene_type:complete